jgi:hypothetical protein
MILIMDVHNNTISELFNLILPRIDKNKSSNSIYSIIIYNFIS